MADIKFTCPHCKVHIECPEEFEGQSSNCPECNGVLVIKRDAVPKLTVVKNDKAKEDISSSKEKPFEKPITCSIFSICACLSFIGAFVSFVFLVACSLFTDDMEGTMGSLACTIFFLVCGFVERGAGEYLFRKAKYAHDTLEATERIAQLLEKQKN